MPITTWAPGRCLITAGRRGEELAKVRGADTGGRVPSFGAVETVPVVCEGRLRAKRRINRMNIITIEKSVSVSTVQVE